MKTPPRTLVSTVTTPITIGLDTPSTCMPAAPLLVGNALVDVLDTELEDAVELLWKDELADDEDTGWPLFPTPCEWEWEPLCDTLRSRECLFYLNSVQITHLEGMTKV